MASLGALLSRRGQEPIGPAIQLAAQLGPEAERVLGPGLQRAAYRYRGTERRPSRALMQAREQYAVTNGGRNGAETVGWSRTTRPAGLVTPEQSRWRSAVTRWRRTSARSCPAEGQAELSCASGRVPPSRGAIIDADGDIITEAVGINGDHYVPFDLKNLGRMEGGQYVRTRAAGGPTREDLYTGLLSGRPAGAGRVHSGVFTIELDPTCAAAVATATRPGRWWAGTRRSWRR